MFPTEILLGPSIGDECSPGVLFLSAGIDFSCIRLLYSASDSVFLHSLISCYVIAPTECACSCCILMGYQVNFIEITQLTNLYRISL